MQLTNLLILGGALGAMAHPSPHGHRAAHDKRATFMKADHQTVTTTVTAVETATTSIAHTSSTATTTSTASSSASTGTYKDFCTGSSKRATLAEIASAGNTGTTYGCNIMQVDTGVISKYDYTISFTNKASTDYQLICANKVGKDGGVNGFFKGSESVITTVAAGVTAAIAVQADSLGSCFFAPGSVPTSPYGQYMGSWVEFSFGVSANKNWSGADCSCLVALAYSASIPACSVCDSSTCSIITEGAGAGSSNAYSTNDTVTADGIGLNIPAGSVHLTATMG
jgi:hypothetical protein